MAVGRSQNLGEGVVILWAQSTPPPQVGIGLTCLPKSAGEGGGELPPDPTVLYNDTQLKINWPSANVYNSDFRYKGYDYKRTSFGQNIYKNFIFQDRIETNTKVVIWNYWVILWSWLISSLSQNVEIHYLSLRTIMVWKQDALGIQLSEHQILTN